MSAGEVNTTPPRQKGIHVGAPACFALELACRQITDAFGGFGCYVVGSALERPNWRDVDVRLILSDQEFKTLFPDAGEHWEHDTRWLLMTLALSRLLSTTTGLPVDFQIQPQSYANERHPFRRSAIGMRIPKGKTNDGHGPYG